MSIITINGRDYDRRYLTSWNYNAALILDELEKIVLNNGGAIVSTWQKERKQFAITNRSIMGAIREEQERIERWTKADGITPKETRQKAIQAAREHILELEQIPNAPHVTPYGDYTYICFMLNGFYYYYSMDRNPFFDFHYSKTPIVNGEINKNHYCNNDKKEWFFDCFWRWNCSVADIKEAANLIFNMLCNSATTGQHGKPRMEKLIVIKGETL